MIDFVTAAATVVSLSISSESRVTRAEDAFFVVITSPRRSLFSSALDEGTLPLLHCTGAKRKRSRNCGWFGVFCLFVFFGIFEDCDLMSVTLCL